MAVAKEAVHAVHGVGEVGADEVDDPNRPSLTLPGQSRRIPAEMMQRSPASFSVRSVIWLLYFPAVPATGLFELCL
jgi:hypothetical protein